MMWIQVTTVILPPAEISKQRQESNRIRRNCRLLEVMLYKQQIEQVFHKKLTAWKCAEFLFTGDLSRKQEGKPSQM